jgi:putative membrane protein
VSPRVLSFHHLLKALILFGFAIYIAQLVRTDKILLYIAPRMVDYVKWSAVGLYAIAVYQLYQTVRTLFGKPSAVCDCGHDHDHDHMPSRSLLKNSAVYGIFIFPLLLAFLLPDTSMGSSLAAKKGMNLSSSSSVKKDTPAAPADQAAEGKAVTDSSELFPADKFTQHYAKHAAALYQQDVIKVPEDIYIETLTTVDLYLDRFVGKKLELTGFVYRTEEMKSNQFVVGRFSIQCCSADAAPFGVLIEYDRAQTYADDSWVTVTGTIGKTKFNDVDIMVLKVEKVAKAAVPAVQYVYPNYDFGT